LIDSINLTIRKSKMNTTSDPRSKANLIWKIIVPLKYCFQLYLVSFGINVAFVQPDLLIEFDDRVLTELHDDVKAALTHSECFELIGDLLQVWLS
jgi:hypothetical protein